MDHFSPRLPPHPRHIDLKMAAVLWVAIVTVSIAFGFAAHVGLSRTERDYQSARV
jgi:hypothetical protein